VPDPVDAARLGDEVELEHRALQLPAAVALAVRRQRREELEQALLDRVPHPRDRRAGDDVEADADPDRHVGRAAQEDLCRDEAARLEVLADGVDEEPVG